MMSTVFCALKAHKCTLPRKITKSGQWRVQEIPKGGGGG